MTFDTILKLARATTGAAKRGELVEMLMDVRPVSPAREQTAPFANKLFGATPDHEKVDLAVKDEAARTMLFHWAKDSPLSVAVELALSKDVCVAGWSYTKFTSGAMFLYAVAWVH